MSLDDKYKDVQTAREIQELSSNAGLRLIFEGLRAAYLDGIAQSDPTDPEYREELFRYYRCSLDLEAQMTSLISAGQISKYQIDQVVNRKPH
jgi:hypothetical protein